MTAITECWVLCEQGKLLAQYRKGWLVEQPFDYCCAQYRVFVDTDFDVWFLPMDFDYELAISLSKPKQTRFYTGHKLC